MTILCICTFYKGIEFLKTAKNNGDRVLLLTHKKLENANWPRESIDEFYYLENVDNSFANYQKIIEGTQFLMRSQKIDVVVALDDFDVEKAALIREQFRIGGMGQTTARHFRDKLAMRKKAKDNDILVPDFTTLFNDLEITSFLQNTQGPWLIKPRLEASATGIKKVANLDQAWQAIHDLGNERPNYLMECFRPGDVYHVDALMNKGQAIFTSCSQYLNTPMEVAHGGGIFRTAILDQKSEDGKALTIANEKVLKAFGLQFGASHTEFIKNKENGQFYFLETASRVGGAHIAEMVEFATNINLWREWANIEHAKFYNKTYKLPKTDNNFAGIIISLINSQKPNMEAFNDSEVVWQMQEDYHLGLIVKSKKREVILALLEKYASNIYSLGYHASAPSPDKSIH